LTIRHELRQNGARLYVAVMCDILAQPQALAAGEQLTCINFLIGSNTRGVFSIVDEGQNATAYVQRWEVFRAAAAAGFWEVMGAGNECGG
jgi:hypothetical protein